jgi:hypothetical protein
MKKIIIPASILLVIGLLIFFNASLDSSSLFMRKLALMKESNQALLAKIAVENHDADMREAAEQRVKDRIILERQREESQRRLNNLKEEKSQANLLKSALGDSWWAVREAAVSLLNDQSALAKVVIESSESEIRNAAAQKLNSQDAIAMVVISVKDTEIRKTFFNKLTDQSALAKVVIGTNDSEIRNMAFVKLNDQNALAEVLANIQDDDVHEKVIEKLRKQLGLNNLGANDIATGILKAVIERSNDQSLLSDLARGYKNFDIRLLATERLTDQNVLTKLASSDPAGAIRIRAIRNITSTEVLETRAHKDDSLAVRQAAIETITDEDALLRLATTHDGEIERNAACDKVKSEENQNQINRFKIKLEKKIEALAAMQDNAAIIDAALKGEFDVIRQGAAKAASKDAVKQIALASTDRDICKIVLTKLDASTCAIVAAEAKSPELKLAASVKSGKSTWTRAFADAAAQTNDKKSVGKVIAAVALFGNFQEQAKEGVVQTCLTFIRRGDESRIPELSDLLENYGDVTLAEDYLNCGQPDLYKSGAKWGNEHGYSITAGYGSQRAIWGSR